MSRSGGQHIEVDSVTNWGVFMFLILLFSSLVSSLGGHKLGGRGVGGVTLVTALMKGSYCFSVWIIVLHQKGCVWERIGGLSLVG